MCEGGHLTPILISKSLQYVNRIMQAFPENCDDSPYLLDPTTVAATGDFWVPLLGLAGLQRELPQIASLISKATNLTAKNLVETNKELGELRPTVLQNRATINFLLLQHDIGCQQYPGISCFNIADFCHTSDNQADNLCKEIDKISNKLDWPIQLIWF